MQKSLHRLLVIAFFMQILSCGLFAQSDSEDKPISFWQVGTDFSSNSSILGRVNSFVQQPSLSVYTSYFGKKGLDVTVMGSNVWNSDTTGTLSTQEYEINLGYNLDVFSWMSMNASYSHFFLDRNSSSVKSMYTDLLQVNVFNEWKWWMFDLGAGYTFGNRKELFLNVQSGINLEFEDVLVNNSLLIIQPSVGVYASNQEYYDVIAYEQFWYLYNYASRRPEQTVLEFTDKIISSDSFFANRLKLFWERNPEDYQRFLKLEDQQVIWELFQPKNQFTFTNLNFNLPLYYYWGDMLFYVSATLSKQLNLPDYLESEQWETYISAGVSYTIKWW
jgi:hypothetical protein